MRNATAMVSKAKVAPKEEMHHKGGPKYIRHVGIWLLGVSIWAVICLPALSFAMPCKTEWVAGGWYDRGLEDLLMERRADAQVHVVSFLVRTAAACYFQQRLESWKEEAKRACKTEAAADSFKSLSRWMKAFIYSAYASEVCSGTGYILILFCIEFPASVWFVSFLGDMASFLWVASHIGLDRMVVLRLHVSGQKLEAKIGAVLFWVLHVVRFITFAVAAFLSKFSTSLLDQSEWPIVLPLSLTFPFLYTVHFLLTWAFHIYTLQALWRAGTAAEMEAKESEDKVNKVASKWVKKTVIIQFISIFTLALNYVFGFFQASGIVSNCECDEPYNMQNPK